MLTTKEDIENWYDLLHTGDTVVFLERWIVACPPAPPNVQRAVMKLISLRDRRGTTWDAEAVAEVKAQLQAWFDVILSEDELPAPMRAIEFYAQCVKRILDGFNWGDSAEATRSALQRLGGMPQKVFTLLDQYDAVWVKNVAAADPLERRNMQDTKRDFMLAVQSWLAELMRQANVLRHEAADSLRWQRRNAVLEMRLDNIRSLASGERDPRG